MSPSPAIQKAEAGQPDLAALKLRQHAAWSSGDYAVVGTNAADRRRRTVRIPSILRSDRRFSTSPPENGNVTLAAARRWCDVVSTDYVPRLLKRGRLRAAAEGLSSNSRRPTRRRWALPTPALNIVCSTFGVMFAPDHDKAAAELARVCKSGGKSAGQLDAGRFHRAALQGCLGKYLPPPAGSKSPLLWGSRAHIGEMFGAAALSIRTESRHLRVPLPIARALRGSFQELLRADAESLCGARRGEPAGIRKRSAHADRTDESRRRRHDGRSERIP